MFAALRAFIQLSWLSDELTLYTRIVLTPKSARWGTSRLQLSGSARGSMKLEGSPNGLSVDAVTAPRGNLSDSTNTKVITPDLALGTQCPWYRTWYRFRRRGIVRCGWFWEGLVPHKSEGLKGQSGAQWLPETTRTCWKSKSVVFYYWREWQADKRKGNQKLSATE